jgi:hypothetical protein
VVEAQHLTSTRKLVDSDAEQTLLEQALDELKPAVPVAARGLHYLLSTPFRYPPLRHGSRFATRQEPSPWYGSEHAETAFSEAAFYRLSFLSGTRAKLEPLNLELTLFRARIRSKRAVDLSAPPFLAYAARISSKTSYRDSQALGSAMREDGVALLKYKSARDPKGHANVALFEPAFSKSVPDELTTWSCHATRDVVEFSERNYFRKSAFAFRRRDFEVRGKLPEPATA